VRADISERFFRTAVDLRNKRKKVLTASQIAADIQAFLERGGLIQKIPIGETGEQDVKDGFKQFSRFHEKERRDRSRNAEH
jgi:hypothetical protein